MLFLKPLDKSLAAWYNEHVIFPHYAVDDCLVHRRPWGFGAGS